MSLIYDTSIKLHSIQYNSSKNSRTRQLLQRQESLNVSPVFNDSSILKNLNDTSLRQVLEETSMTVNTRNAGEGLNEAFFEIIRASHSNNIIDTLARLAQVCRDSLELLEPWNRCDAQNYWLAEEANTWKLLHCLYSDSLAEHPESFENLIKEATLSQQTLVNALFRSDSELRLLQLLVDWLEATAAYQQEAIKACGIVISNDIHWGNTLQELLIGTSLFNKERNKSMVTCIDPDASNRQKKVIHSDDLQDDNYLCMSILTKIRCGKFKEAVSMCINAGQAWRGAVLQGWSLLHYLHREESVDSLEITGNPSRDLWKWCALGIANNVAENCHYRATIGILSGHLHSVLPVCDSSWEDLLWALLRVQIEARVDKFLHEHHATVDANTTTSEVLELLQSEHKVEELGLQQIFSAVKALMDGEKESYYQMCQRYLMLGHIRAILQDSVDRLDNTEERIVRFLAHLVLVLRLMGKDPLHDIGDKILERYVTLLVEQLTDGAVQCPELVAYYVSTVPVERQIVLYADFMDHIHKSDYRQSVVKAGLTAGIDIAASARMAIKKAITDIQQGYGNLDLTFTQTTTMEKDKTLISKVISSLEWLSLIPNQFQEALWLSNAMIRTFIFIGNTDAALLCIGNVNRLFPEFFNKIPSISSELREHLCLKAYLDGLEGYVTWYKHFISDQPKDAEPLSEDATFSDKVHYEQICAQVEQQKARWFNVVSHQSKHAKKLLYNVLLFPGGWLQDESDGIMSEKFSESENIERMKQLNTLRHLCIPEVVILILKILQSNEDINNHKEAVKLSNIIAGENRWLYKVFTKNKLMAIIDKIKESSLLLLEKGKDMFGYEIND